jgi:hypothetical protein
MHAYTPHTRSRVSAAYDVGVVVAATITIS